MNPQPLIVPSNSKPFLPIIGDRIRCLLDGRATGGVFALFEQQTPPGAGSPPHLHRREEETFFVISGQVEFWIDGKTTLAGPGATVFGPRNIPHCFRNVGPTPSHVIMMASPAGIENFFAATARLAPEPPPPMPAFAQLCAQFGIELLPPS